MAKEDNNIYYCVGCGKIHPKGSFYVSYSPNHANGRLFYCKDYIKNKVYKRDSEIDVEKLKDILRQLDLPFLDDVFESAHSSGGDIVGHYFRIFNSLPQNRGLSWKDSSTYSQPKENNETESQVEEDIIKNVNELSDKDISKLEEKWGYGYSPDELYLFEKKYLMLKNNYTEKTAMHTEALYNYIRYRVKEEIATAEGNVKEAKEWGQLASQAATHAKINPSQLSKADLSDGLSTFSELSQALEKEIDIIRILPRFKFRPNDALDFNIWCYINYMQDLSGLPHCNYEDVYEFYDRKIQDYIEQYGDPYEIFKDDPTIKNRESIKKFIKEDGDN